MIAARDRVIFAIASLQFIVIALGIFCFYRITSDEYRLKKHASTRYPQCIGHINGRPVCEVIGSDFSAAADRLHGRLVRVPGYLAVDGGVASLYPSESDYLHRINNHSLVLRAPLDVQRRLIDAFGNRYVRLVGTYLAVDEASTRTGRIGALRVEKAEAIPPRQDRESSVDILVNVEDLVESR